MLFFSPQDAGEQSGISNHRRNKEVGKTDCTKKTVKRAFLFTCFCRLRYSDVEALKWGDIQTDNEEKKIIKYRQKKTKKSEYLQVSEEALKQLPEQNEAKEEDKIFQLSQNRNINQTLAG